MNHNNNMKRLGHCLWLYRKARTIGIFPGWTEYFLRKNSGEFEGEFRLAHQRANQAEHLAARCWARCIEAEYESNGVKLQRELFCFPIDAGFEKV